MQPSGLPQVIKKTDSVNAMEQPNHLNRTNFSNNMCILGILTKRSEERPDLLEGISQLPKIRSVESYGNIFRGFNEEQPAKTGPQKNELSQTYEIECLEYEKYCFDSRIKLIIKKMAINAYNIYRNERESEFLVLPIQKILTLATKKLLLNRFELLFLQYVIQETKFRYDIECIRFHTPNFKSYLLISESENRSLQVKYMQVYILYCAYYSKKSLNQLPPENIFTQFLRETCPEFKQHFQQWTQKSCLANKINPKVLNHLFRKLNTYSQKGHEDVQNFCLMAEEIMYICPAYNPEKCNRKKGGNKRSGTKKNEKNMIEGRVNEDIKVDIRDQNNEQVAKFQQIVQQQGQFELDPPLFKTKKSSYLSNVDGLEPRHYIHRNYTNSFN